MALSKALGTDLSALAQIIKSKGRGKDTVLAHITPKEAALLKARGGRGSTNPDTGLPEFDDEMAAPQELDAGGSMAQQANVPPISSGGEGTYNAPVGITGQTPGTETASVAPVPTETYGGAVNAPATVPFSAADIQAGQAPTPAALQQFQTANPPPSDVAGAMQSLSSSKPEESGFLDKALAGLSKPDTLGRLGITGALGAYGAYQGKQAQAQSDAAAAQKQALAQPYQQQGQQLVGAAQRGELTPANQQVIQQQRARLAQSSANMGGVGQQQIENQISSLTSQLLQNQYQYGLQVMQIGDNIALGAINTQLQLDQQLTNANKSFYTGLAQLVAGSPTYITQTKVGG
jgi:hypothetical protein